jgi:hypothetical protein
LATFATNDDNAAICSIGKKQKQLHYQRDPSVATDYYIQSTEQEPISGQAAEKRL